MAGCQLLTLALFDDSFAARVSLSTSLALLMTRSFEERVSLLTSQSPKKNKSNSVAPCCMAGCQLLTLALFDDSFAARVSLSTSLALLMTRSFEARVSLTPALFDDSFAARVSLSTSLALLMTRSFAARVSLSTSLALLMSRSFEARVSLSTSLSAKKHCCVAVQLVQSALMLLLM
jgi:hypothetical protein